MSQEQPDPKLPKESLDFINKAPPWFAQVIEFRKTLDSETDRGCALMAAAFLDVKLEQLLRQAFVDDEKVVGPLFDFSGPFGTFSSRIDSAYVTGRIGERARQDLHLIRRIRNDFGHNPEPIGFDHEPIAARCRELYYNRFSADALPRHKFTNAAFGIVGYIEATIQKSPRLAKGDDIEMPEDRKFAFDELVKKVMEMGNDTSV